MFNWRKPVIYSLLYLTGSKVPRNLKEIESIQNLSREDIKEYQNKKLKDLLLHAYNTVPYYHKVLGDVKVVVDGEVNLDYFDKIPVLNRDILTKEFENLKSKNPKGNQFINHSGGSTGKPVRFIQDNYYWDSNVANKIYYAELNGKYIGEKEIKLWGSDRDILKGSIGLKAKIYNFLYNRIFLNSFDMDESKIKKYIRVINKKKPKLLWGYVNSLEIISDYIIKNNLNMYSPKIIFSAAGTLTEDIRKKIKKAFNTKVVNIYGTREVGDLAFEFEENNQLYITDYSHKVEVDGNGNILITTLNNYSMPLIRYEIGDISSGLLEPKENHSLKFSILKGVLGRKTSIFKTKEGKKIPPEYFIHMIGVAFNTGFIKKFQVIQKDYEKVLVNLVLNGRKDSKQLINIEKSIKRVMGKNCKVNFKFLDNIKLTKSGKFLYTISRLK